MTDPRLKLIVLKTAQIESVRDFYARLGFQFVEEQHGTGPRHFSAPLGDGVLEIYPLPDGAKADSTTRLGFGVSDLGSAVGELSDGIGPKQTEWGVAAVLLDPDGRSVELYEET